MADIKTLDVNKVTSKASSTTSTTTSLVGQVGGKVSRILDNIISPEKRAEWLTWLQDFAVKNPKIAAFLVTNIVLSAGPLFLFVVFSITVFIVSLIAGLLIGLVGALLFTAFMLLVALFVVLPTLFLTTMAATFLFLWGLGGYYLLQWFNKGETPAEVGNAIGDKLNRLTGGRLDSLMSGARETFGLQQQQQGQKEKGGQANQRRQRDGSEKGYSSSGEGHGMSTEKMSKNIPRTPTKGL